MTDQSDDRSSLALAVAWASMVTTVALEMAVPAILGHWLDGKWGTQPVLVLVGTVIGFSVGLLHLLRWSSRMGKQMDDMENSSNNEQEKD